MNYTISTRVVPAYLGGHLYQYTATHDGDSARCSDVAIAFFEKHASITGPHRERAWSILVSAITDSLWPTKANEVKETDQIDAAAWFESESAEDIMDSLGLNPDFVRHVMATLSEEAEGD